MADTPGQQLNTNEDATPLPGQSTEGVTPKPPKSLTITSGPGGALTPKEAIEYNGFLDGNSSLPMERVHHYEKKLGVAIAPLLNLDSGGQVDYHQTQLKSWADETLKQDPNTWGTSREALALRNAYKSLGPSASNEEITQEFSNQQVSASFRKDMFGRQDPKKSQQEANRKRAEQDFQQTALAEEVTGIRTQQAISDISKFSKYEIDLEESVRTGKKPPSIPKGYKEFEQKRSAPLQQPEALPVVDSAIDPTELDRYILSARVSGDSSEAEVLQEAKERAAKGATREEVIDFVEAKRIDLYTQEYQRTLREGLPPPTPPNQEYQEGAYGLVSRLSQEGDLGFSYDEESGVIKVEAKSEEAQRAMAAARKRQTEKERASTGEYFLGGEAGQDLRAFVNTFRQSGIDDWLRSIPLSAEASLGIPVVGGAAYLAKKAKGELALPALEGKSDAYIQVYNTVYAEASSKEKDRLESDPVYAASVVSEAAMQSQASRYPVVEAIKEVQKQLPSTIVVPLDGITVNTAELQDNLTDYYVLQHLRREYGEDFDYSEGTGEDWKALSEEEKKKAILVVDTLVGDKIASVMASGSGLIWSDRNPWASTAAIADLPAALRVPASVLMPQPVRRVLAEDYKEAQRESLEREDSRYFHPRIVDLQKQSRLDYLNKMFFTTWGAGVLPHYRKELLGMSDAEYKEYADSDIFPGESIEDYEAVPLASELLTAARVTEQMVKSVDLALGITETDPLRRRRQVARLRDGEFLAEEGGIMFGDLADALEVEDPDLRNLFVRTGQLGYFALEFGPAGAGWFEPVLVGVGRTAQAALKAEAKYFSASSKLDRLAAKGRQGTVSPKEASLQLQKSDPYHAKLAEARATSDATLYKDEMKAQQRLINAAQKQWKVSGKAAEDAGIVRRTSPDILPDSGIGSNVGKDVYLARKFDEYKKTGIGREKAIELAKADLAEDLSKYYKQANESTNPMDLYKAIRTDSRGMPVDEYFIRWVDDAGKAEWHRWFQTGTDGNLIFKGIDSLDGRSLRKAGFALDTKDGRSFIYSPRNVGEVVDPPIGAFRANEALLFEGTAGEFLAQNNAVAWEVRISPDQYLLSNPRVGDLWRDVYEPGARVGFMDTPTREVKQLKQKKVGRKQFRTRTQIKDPLERAVLETPIPREVPEPVSARPPQAKTLGAQVELANKYHNARADMLKIQLEAAESRAAAMEEISENFAKIEGFTTTQLDEVKNEISNIERLIKENMDQMKHLEGDEAKVIGIQRARATKLAKAEVVYEARKVEVKEIRERIVSPPMLENAQRKEALLREAMGKEDIAKARYQERVQEYQEALAVMMKIGEKKAPFVNRISVLTAQKNILEMRVYGIEDTLRAVKGGVQEDETLKRLINAARKQADPKKKQKLLLAYEKRRTELQQAPVKIIGESGQPIREVALEPTLGTHLSEGLQASGAQMAKSLKAASREAERQAKATRRAFDRAKALAKKTGKDWDMGLIRKAVRAKRVAEALEKKSTAYWRALAGVASDIREGEAALLKAPALSARFVNILEGAVVREPPKPKKFWRMLRRQGKLTEDGTYVIDAQKLTKKLENEWGVSTLAYTIEKIGTKGEATRGGEAADILARIVNSTEDMVPLSLQEVSVLQDVNLALRESWFRAHDKARQMGVVQALQIAKRDVSGTLGDVGWANPTQWNRAIREALNTLDPIKSELGEVAEGVENTLKAVRNYNDNLSSEIFNLSRRSDEILKARKKAGELDEFDFNTTQEFQRSLLFEYLDGNAPMDMKLRAPILPLGSVPVLKELFRPELGRTTWANLGDVSLWQQMRRQVLNDPRVKTELARMKEHEAFLDVAEGLLKEAKQLEANYSDWKSAFKSADEETRTLLTATMESWIEGGKKKNLLDIAGEVRMAQKGFLDETGQLVMDKSNGVVWALSRSLLPAGKIYSPQTDAFIYAKTVEILRGSEGATAKNFHQALTEIYLGKTLTKRQVNRLKYIGFDESSVDNARSVGMITLAAAHGAVQDKANKLLAKSVGGFMTADEFSAANKMLSGDYANLSPGELNKATGVLNKTGRPMTQNTVQLDAETKRFTKFVQTGEDLSGRNYYMTKTLADSIDASMPKVIKELQEQYSRARTLSGAKAGNIAGRIDLLGWWRASIVTGLAVPQPRYFINNFWGDFSQIWLTEGFRQATHTSTQFLMGVPWWSKRLVEVRSSMAKKLGVEMDEVLPDLTTSLFNPHINNIFQGKDGFLRTKDGRVLQNRSVLQGAIERGIMDTFIHENTLRSFTAGAEKNLRAKTAVKTLADQATWVQDISETAAFVQQRQRFALYTNLIAQGYTEAAAAKKVMGALYDWKHSVSQWEARLITSWAPFYRFWKLALKQAATGVSEPLIRPSKAMLKKTLTGQGSSARVHQQYVAVNQLHPFLDPDVLEDHKEDRQKLQDSARHVVPSWNKHRAITKVDKLPERERRFNINRYGVKNPVTHSFSTLGPFTALDTVELLGTWMSGMAAAFITNEAVTFPGQEDLKVGLSADWETNVLESTVDLLTPTHKQAVYAVMDMAGMDTPRKGEMVRATATEEWWAKNGPQWMGLTEEDLSYKDGKPMVSRRVKAITGSAPVLLEFHKLFDDGVFNNPYLSESEGGREFTEAAKYAIGRFTSVDRRYPFRGTLSESGPVNRIEYAVNKEQEKALQPLDLKESRQEQQYETIKEQREREKTLEEELKRQEEESGEVSPYPFLRSE